jgi:signal transduction histidine kinase
VAVIAGGAYLVIRDRALDQVDRALQQASARVIADLDQSDIGAGGFSAAPGPDSPDSGDLTDDAPTPPGTDLEVEVRDGGDLPVGGPRTVELDGIRYRTLVLPLPMAAGGERGQTVGFYRSLEDVEATVRITGWALLSSAVLAALLAIALVLTIVRRALRPLTQAHAAAAQIAATGDPSIRIPEGRPDEVGLLARTMNTMLERLQGAQSRLRRTLDEQRRFAADASHELRTPLTVLRGDIDLLRAHDPPAEERQTILGEMSEAAERMGRMTEGLLSLARLDAGGRQDVAAVSVEDLVRDLLDGDETLEVDLSAAGARVEAEPDGVRSLFANLIDNARRYGGRVGVVLGAEDRELVAVVSDDGPGIAPEDRDRIFDRFFRGRRVRGTPDGAGLGLAIARGGAEAAGGSLVLLDREPGAHFEVRLPLAGEPG